jgi:hypothetical protein
VHSPTPRFVPPDNLGSLRIDQSRLFLTERWDESRGRSVTSLTRENALQTRHDVGVGVTTHQLHSRRPCSAARVDAIAAHVLASYHRMLTGGWGRPGSRAPAIAWKAVARCGVRHGEDS